LVCSFKILYFHLSLVNIYKTWRDKSLGTYGGYTILWFFVLCKCYETINIFVSIFEKGSWPFYHVSDVVPLDPVPKLFLGYCPVAVLIDFFGERSIKKIFIIFINNSSGKHNRNHNRGRACISDTKSSSFNNNYINFKLDFLGQTYWYLENYSRTWFYTSVDRLVIVYIMPHGRMLYIL